MRDEEENVVLKLKIGKINGEKYRIVHKTSTIKKLQWIIKKFKEKNGGYLVNKLESYQHFVCG